MQHQIALLIEYNKIVWRYQAYQLLHCSYSTTHRKSNNNAFTVYGNCRVPENCLILMVKINLRMNCYLHQLVSTDIILSQLLRLQLSNQPISNFTMLENKQAIEMYKRDDIINIDDGIKIPRQWGEILTTLMSIQLEQHLSALHPRSC